MGYDNTIRRLDLSSEEAATEVDTVLDWAQQAGKKTGFVTNTRMGHATPAALYAKTASRFWECENDWIKDVEEGKINQEDIEKYQVGCKYHVLFFTQLILATRHHQAAGGE